MDIACISIIGFFLTASYLTQWSVKALPQHPECTLPIEVGVPGIGVSAPFIRYRSSSLFYLMMSRCGHDGFTMGLICFSLILEMFLSYNGSRTSGYIGADHYNQQNGGNYDKFHCRKV